MIPIRTSDRSMRIDQTTIRIIGFTLLALFTCTGNAQTITNDLETISPGYYRVNGDDPFIIFDSRQQAQQPKYLKLDLDDKLVGLPLEIFFRGNNDLFDPYYKINFTATSFPTAIELPTDISFTQNSRLRLDINYCKDCNIKIDQLPVLIGQLDAGVTLTKPSRVQNGLKLIETTAGLISTEEWQLNDISGDPSNFEISANDPFLASPGLTVSTLGISGVYFKMKAPKSDQLWNNYHLFYQTERHQFSIQASSTVRIIDSESEFVELVFPLDFLNKEHPSDGVLERIRLDIPDILGAWSLIEVRLVDHQRMKEFQKLIPTKLIQMKKKRPSGLLLIKKSLSNVISDLGFSISYLLLLISIAWFFRRAYRSNN
ncbi:MAG: hypothetical protein ACJARN_001845 [Arenicella sp.]|jgi:hypothetical protein